MVTAPPSLPAEAPPPHGRAPPRAGPARRVPGGRGERGGGGGVVAGARRPAGIAGSVARPCFRRAVEAPRAAPGGSRHGAVAAALPGRRRQRPPGGGRRGAGRASRRPAAPAGSAGTAPAPPRLSAGPAEPPGARQEGPRRWGGGGAGPVPAAAAVRERSACGEGRGKSWAGAVPAATRCLRPGRGSFVYIPLLGAYRGCPSEKRPLSGLAAARESSGVFGERGRGGARGRSAAGPKQSWRENFEVSVWKLPSRKLS